MVAGGESMTQPTQRPVERVFVASGGDAALVSLIHDKWALARVVRHLFAFTSTKVHLLTQEAVVGV